MDENKQAQAQANEVDEVDSENKLNETIKQSVKNVRDTSFIYGAKMICGAAIEIMQKHIMKKTSPSLRDYERCVKELYSFLSVPLAETKTDTQQNDLEELTDDNVRKD